MTNQEIEKLSFGGKSSNFEASFNFVNSLLGAGIIGIPLAIQQCGLVMGILVFALVAFFIYQSVTMMVACGIQKKLYNLEDLAEGTLGSVGFYVSTIAMCIFACGGQIAYLVIIGDTVPSVAHFISSDNIFTNRSFSLWIFSTFIILPLCLFRELGHLAWTSFFCIILEVVLLIVIAYASFLEHSQHSETGFQPSDVSDINMSVFAGVGTMSFALVCQHNSFLLFQSLEHPTMSNWKQVAAQSIAFGFVISLLVGLVGFIAFYPEVEGDILNNFPTTSGVVGLARGVLAATMLFTYPMELYVSRHCLVTLLQRWRRTQRHHNHHDTNNSQSISTSEPHHNGRVSDEEENALHDHIELVSPVSSSSQQQQKQHQQHHRSFMSSLSRTQKRQYKKVTNMDDPSDPPDHSQTQINPISSPLHPVIDHGFDDDDNEEFEVIDFMSPINHTPVRTQPSVSSHKDTQLDTDDSQHPVSQHPSSTPPISLTEHLLWTIGIWLFTLIVALSARELGVVSALTGTIAASTLGYTLPALIFFRCHEADWHRLLRSIHNGCVSLIKWQSYETSLTVCGESLDDPLYNHNNIWPLLSLFALPTTLLVFGVATFFIGITTILVSS